VTARPDTTQVVPAHESSGNVVAERVELTRDVLLTRGQAARRMGVSIATVRRMEGAELQPILVGGKHCFPIEDVDRNRKATDGDLAAQVFRMFNEDKTQVEVVIALKESPDRIRKLFHDWIEMSDCIVAGPPGLGQRRLRRYLGGRITRRLVMVCLEMVFADPKLRARAEREFVPDKAAHE
jgi:hypothetical protein